MFKILSQKQQGRGWGLYFFKLTVFQGLELGGTGKHLSTQAYLHAK